MPLTRLPAGLAQHELAERDNQPGFLGQRNEKARRNQAFLRMTPAHQRFGRIQAVFLHAQPRLIEDLQLAFLDGATQLVFQLEIFQARHLQALGEELQGVAAQMFGMLHGHVCLQQQRGRLP